MKPSELAKKAGLKSLNEMSELSGWTVRALNKMFHDHPLRFRTVAQGAMLKKLTEALKEGADLFDKGEL